MFKGFQQLGNRRIMHNQQLFDGYFKPFNKSAVLNNYIRPYEWWSAEANYTIDGINRVSSWKGMYKELEFIQATLANQPVLTLSALDDRNSLKFNGTTQRMICDFGATLAQPNTIIVIAKFNSNAANQYIYDGISTTSRERLHHVGSGNIWQRAGVGTSVGTSVLQYNMSLPTTFIMFTNIYYASNSKFFTNGVLRTSGVIESEPLTGLTIGANVSGTTYFFNGEITDIILFNRILANSEMRQMHQLLANYYPTLNITL